MEFDDILKADGGGTLPFIIAGPCSAESEPQLMSTAEALSSLGVPVLRAGLWKPRTRPGNFEGVGSTGLEWMRRVRESTGMSMATEVASASHVKACVEAGVEVLWIGTRTSGNPFSMDEIARALADAPSGQIVLVKNPLSPNIEAWIGAIERIQKSGLENIGIILRGFYDFASSEYRNPPHWEVAEKMREMMPRMPIIIDPSHMAGRRSLVPGLIREGRNRGFNAFMIECHIDPDSALTDARQQLPPEEFKRMMDSIF